MVFFFQDGYSILISLSQDTSEKIVFHVTVSLPFRIAHLPAHVGKQLGLEVESDAVDYYDVGTEEWVQHGLEGLCEFGTVRRLIFRRPGVTNVPKLKEEITRLKQRPIPSGLLFKKNTPLLSSTLVQQPLTAFAASVTCKRQRSKST